MIYLREEATTNQSSDAYQASSEKSECAGFGNCRRRNAAGHCKTSQSATITLGCNYAKVNSKAGQLADLDIRNRETECRSLGGVGRDGLAITKGKTANISPGLEQVRRSNAEVTNRGGSQGCSGIHEDVAAAQLNAEAGIHDDGDINVGAVLGQFDCSIRTSDVQVTLGKIQAGICRTSGSKS